MYAYAESDSGRARPGVGSMYEFSMYELGRGASPVVYFPAAIGGLAPN